MREHGKRTREAASATRRSRCAGRADAAAARAAAIAALLAAEPACRACSQPSWTCGAAGHKVQALTGSAWACCWYGSLLGCRCRHVAFARWSRTVLCVHRGADACIRLSEGCCPLGDTNGSVTAAGRRACVVHFDIATWPQGHRGISGCCSLFCVLWHVTLGPHSAVKPHKLGHGEHAQQLVWCDLCTSLAQPGK